MLACALLFLNGHNLEGMIWVGNATEGRPSLAELRAIYRRE